MVHTHHVNINIIMQYLLLMSRCKILSLNLNREKKHRLTAINIVMTYCYLLY